MTDAQAIDRATKGASIAVIAAGVMVVVGTLMTWVTFTGGFLVLDRSGVAYDADAKWMLALAAVAALGAVGQLADVDVLPGIVRMSALVAGAIIVAEGIYAIHQINDKIQVARDSGADGQVGSGVYVALAGGALMVLSGIRLLDARRKAAKRDAPVWNPPPGWPVDPPPSRKWRPDPTWAPAPEGWQFWVSKSS